MSPMPTDATPLEGRDKRTATLDPEHRSLIEWVESLPENQSGADKTWVEQAMRRFQEHYAGARRLA